MAATSGQITVTTAGTAVQGTASIGAGKFMIRALADNAGLVYVGSDGAGDVTASNGYELSPGDAVPYAGDLTDLWFDSAENGDGFTWLKYAPYGVGS